MLRLAEFRDEQAWSQRQLGAYKIILGLWIFLGIEGQKVAQF